MGKKVKIIFLILISLAIISGCESYVNDVRLPDFSKKLVIAAFLNPSDTSGTIYTGSNKPLFGELNTYESPGNLSGTLSDGTVTITLDKLPNGFSFKKSDMTVAPGKTYTLKIDSDLGLSAEAECTVPGVESLNLAVEDLKFTRHEVKYGENMYFISYSMEFGVSFDDAPAESNYYRFAGIIKTFMTQNLSGKQYINQDLIYFKNEYATDKGFDGTRIRINESANIYSPDYSGYDSAFLKIYVYKTDEHYQRYHKSLRSYNSGENPFSEVTPVYSNVKGGLGIFCSYISDSLIYRLK